MILDNMKDNMILAHSDTANIAEMGCILACNISFSSM